MNQAELEGNLAALDTAVSLLFAHIQHRDGVDLCGILKAAKQTLEESPTFAQQGMDREGLLSGFDMTARNMEKLTAGFLKKIQVADTPGESTD